MAITLTINNIPYVFPEQGDAQPWGQDATEWATAVTNALNTFLATGDVLTASTTLLNNQASALGITGLSFDPSILQGFSLEYSIYRSDTVFSAAETGTIKGAYNALTSAWEYSQFGTNIENTGVILSIDSSGQIKYTSTNLTGGTHTCKIVFYAKGFAA
jgi:hypothetical protein